MSRLRVALLCDYAEELWPSMDLVAEMLLQQFASSDIQATRIQPPLRRYLHSRNADRLLNRMLTYPLHARRCREFDIYHVIDHSYAQLIHALPWERTVVTCHDVDTFRCLFSPLQERRPLWFRAMARHILSGLRKAALVVCVSEATRLQLVRHGLVDSSRARVIHNGVHPAYRPEPDPHSDQQAARLLGAVREREELLHVGSTIPRKRIDLLLRIFAGCRARNKRLHLVRVGPPLTAEHRRLALSLGIESHITHLGNVPAKLLAAVYRRAALVLLPSDAEGFGLPLVEAMSCGTPAVISDIPALREVGGDAVASYPVGDITAWSEGLLGLLEERASNARSWYRRTALCQQQAALFSWDRNARELVGLYRTLLP